MQTKSHRVRSTRTPNSSSRGNTSQRRRTRGSKRADTSGVYRTRTRDNHKSSRRGSYRGSERGARRRKRPRPRRNSGRKNQIADYSDISDNSDDDIQISGMTTLKSKNGSHDNLYSFSTVIELEQAVTNLVESYEKIISLSPSIDYYTQVLENKSDLPIGLVPAFSRFQLKLAAELKTLHEQKHYSFLDDIITYRLRYTSGNIEPLFEELLEDEDQHTNSEDLNESDDEVEELDEHLTKQYYTDPSLQKETHNSNTPLLGAGSNNNRKVPSTDEFPRYTDDDLEDDSAESSNASECDGNSDEHSIIELDSDSDDEIVDDLTSNQDSHNNAQCFDINNKKSNIAKDTKTIEDDDDEIIILGENQKYVNYANQFTDNNTSLKHNTKVDTTENLTTPSNQSPLQEFLKSQDEIYSKLNDSWPPELPEIYDSTIKARVFTHQSALENQPYLTPDESVRNSYERFEFLGDSVLNSIITMIIYKLFPTYDAGQMTRTRTLLVSNRRLEKWAYLYGLQNHLIIKKRILKEILNSGNKLYKIYADLFEAYVGGLVEANPKENMPRVREWLTQLAKPAIEKILASNSLHDVDPTVNMNAKKELEKILEPVGVNASFIITSKKSRKQPYSIVECQIAGGQLTGIGKARNVRIAQQVAASNILEKKNLLDKLLENISTQKNHQYDPLRKTGRNNNPANNQSQQDSNRPSGIKWH
ncbi:Ribonuclease III family [Nakaseomyces bracarensis]|uniref:Ribonuclease III family n=1 Tax=Nakaseomyces bracarensis TaxID=273131 RepID=A0ABR4NZR7_9SACH